MGLPGRVSERGKRVVDELEKVAVVLADVRNEVVQPL